MSAIVPEYLVTSSPSVHDGGVAPVNVPQSSTVSASLPESGLTASESVTGPRARANVPLSEPVFWMSTSPVALPPGRRFDAVSTAELALEFTIDSVPVANVLAGLAEAAVKSAPEPITAPAARRSVTSAPSAMRGVPARIFRRDMEGPSLWQVAKLRGAAHAISRVLPATELSRGESGCETSGFASPPRDGF